MNESTALGRSGLGRICQMSRDAHVLKYIPLAALRPHPICRRSRRFLHKLGAKETPPAAAPALAGSLAPPTPGGSRRNSPWRAQTLTRQFPPAAGCTRRYRRGRLLPARLRHCRRAVVPSLRAPHPETMTHRPLLTPRPGTRSTPRAMAKPSPQGFPLLQRRAQPAAGGNCRVDV